jgi:hypothetical protein
LIGSLLELRFVRTLGRAEATEDFFRHAELTAR